MYSNHLAATGAGTTFVLWKVGVPIWAIGLAFVLVGAGLLTTRLYARRHRGGHR